MKLVFIFLVYVLVVNSSSLIQNVAIPEQFVLMNGTIEFEIPIDTFFSDDETIQITLDGTEWLDFSMNEPEFLSRYTAAHSRVQGLYFLENFAYVMGHDPHELIVLDINDPKNMIAHTTGLANQPAFIDGFGDLLYFNEWDGDFHVANISDRVNPEIYAGTTPNNQGQNIQYYDGHVFVTDFSISIRIVDVSDPENPQELDSYLGSSSGRSVSVMNDIAVVANSGSFVVFDVSNISDPINIFSDSVSCSNVVDVEFSSKGYAYVADHSLMGFLIYEVGNGSITPEYKTSKGTYLNCRYVSIGGAEEELLVVGIQDGWILFDISDPISPVELSHTSGLAMSHSVDIHRNLIGITDDNGAALYDFGTITVTGEIPENEVLVDYPVTVIAKTRTQTLETTFLISVVLECFGFQSNDTENVCSGHGNCIDEDLCECIDDLYYGELCSDSLFTYIRGNFYGNGSATYECDSTNAEPAPRVYSCGFSFQNDEVFIFGGQSKSSFDVDSDDVITYYNDVWELKRHYPKTDQKWCFVSGNQNISDINNNDTSTPNQFSDSILEEEDEFSEDHHIGSRSSFGSFASEFSMFIFGGEKFLYNETNELWEFSIVGRDERRRNWRMLYSHNDDEDPPLDEQQPSPRSCLCSASTIDSKFVYFFGGQKVNDSITSDYKMFNDLWEYSILLNTFQKLRDGNDSTSTFDPSIGFETVYEKNREENIINPPHRIKHSCWTDRKDNFYIFGGVYYVSNSVYEGNQFCGNDIWVYNRTTFTWTWISGGLNNSISDISSLNPSDFSTENQPSVRSSSIIFSQYSKLFTEDRYAYFIGGRNLQESVVFGGLWGFDYLNKEFRIVNSTTEFYNQMPNLSQIGSRSAGVGIVTKFKEMIIYGGSGLNQL